MRAAQGTQQGYSVLFDLLALRWRVASTVSRCFAAEISWSRDHERSPGGYIESSSQLLACDREARHVRVYSRKTGKRGKDPT
ncbi:hypothetical protein MRB53_041720 [Persea americana]|nr:hypothetical protein MRB53_041720 [Persea americana]